MESMKNHTKYSLESVVVIFNIGPQLEFIQYQ